MEFEFGGGPAQHVGEAQAALASVTYPLEKVGGKVRVNFPVEPACPGHSEFACTQMYLSGPYVAVIGVRDSTGLPPDQGWHPFSGAPGEWNGRNFYRETIVHELGHVIAGTFVGSQEARDEMCGLFRLMDIMGPEDGRPGQPGDWNSGPWQRHIEEAVAETFKDVFMPKRDRQYDNRTDWRLPQARFRRFLELMGLDFVGDEQKRTRMLYSPDYGHPDEGGVEWGPYGENETWWDHADGISLTAENVDAFWTHSSTAAIYFSGAVLPYTLHELATGTLGGGLAFTLADVDKWGGRAVTLDIDWSQTVMDPLDFSYAHDMIISGDPEAWYNHPEDWERVGWGAGKWSEFAVRKNWGVEWYLFTDGNPNFHLDPADPASVYLKSLSFEVEVVPGQTPQYSGEFPFPRRVAIAEGTWATTQLALRAYMDIGSAPFYGHEAGFNIVPSGPGVVEQQWASREWGLYMRLPPDVMPPWPYTDLIAASAGPVLAVRRSRMSGGVR